MSRDISYCRGKRNGLDCKLKNDCERYKTEEFFKENQVWVIEPAFNKKCPHFKPLNNKN